MAELGAIRPFSATKAELRQSTRAGRSSRLGPTALVDSELSFLAVPPSEPLRRTADYQVPCDSSGSGAALD
jgi:hypothetical protein